MYTLLKSASSRRRFLSMRTLSLVVSFRKVIFISGGRSLAVLGIGIHVVCVMCRRRVS